MDPVQVGQPEGSSTFKGRRLCWWGVDSREVIYTGVKALKHSRYVLRPASLGWRI